MTTIIQNRGLQLVKSTVIIGIAILIAIVTVGVVARSGILIAGASEGSTAQVQINGPSGGWTYIIKDSGHDITTYDSSGGSATYNLDCSESVGTYSLNVQKKAEFGTLTVSVVQDGKVLDARSTSAPFGTVSLAGTCG
jgi:hypothetical protein